MEDFKKLMGRKRIFLYFLLIIELENFKTDVLRKCLMFKFWREIYLGEGWKSPFDLLVQIKRKFCKSYILNPFSPYSGKYIYNDICAIKNPNNYATSIMHEISRENK